MQNVHAKFPIDYIVIAVVLCESIDVKDVWYL